MALQLVVMLSALATTPPAVDPAAACLGEYQLCESGECTLFNCSANVCKAPTPYRCPLPTVGTYACAAATTYRTACPGLKGSHLDWTLSVAARVAALVAATNTTEQIAQLTNAAPAIERLGLPAYQWLNDDEHGVMSSGYTTSFPDGPGLGATFDKALLQAIGRVVGTEARGVHNNQSGSVRPTPMNGMGLTLYGPNMNLVRDPRWGRSQEVYSEDPRLSSALTYGYVTGIQGVGDPDAENSSAKLAGACCKHLAAYDVETDRMTGNADVPTRSFWEHYMPTFHACLIDAGAMHSMCSYNSLNGVPTCADPNLMNGVLRKDWGWKGWAVSDYDAYASIFKLHNYTKTMAEGAAAGLNAGLDQEGGGTAAISQLQPAIEQKLTSAGAVTTAFARLMRARILLGMFDPPASNTYDRIGMSSVRTAAATALNKRAALEGITLLKNGGVGKVPLLPLKLSSFSGRTASLFVAGPTADLAGNTLGNYDCGDSHFDADCVNANTSMLGGLKFSGTGLTGGELLYISGCSSTDCLETDFSNVSAAAATAEVAVVVLGLQNTCPHNKSGGIPSNHCRGYMKNNNSYEQEGHDRTSIELPANQYKLTAAVAKAKPGKTLCVLIHGGTLALKSLLVDCDAIISVWYPGQQGGSAFADILFGKVSPSGRSPQTWYDSDAELPQSIASYDMYAGKGTTYRYYSGVASIPFGFGLSYSAFKYTNMWLNTSSSIGHCDSVQVSVDVSNIGKVVADEVVQLYVTTPGLLVPAPRKRLADFTRIHSLRPGETQTVELVLTSQFRAIVKDDAKANFWTPQIVVMAGIVSLHVAKDSSLAGALTANVTTAGGPLTTSFRCKTDDAVGIAEWESLNEHVNHIGAPLGPFGPTPVPAAASSSSEDSDSAPMLGMDFGPPMSVVVNGCKMSGKASNTLDLYPYGFAYSGAGDDVLGEGDSYSLAPYSVDGGKTFRNASFRPTKQQSWTSFAYFNSSGDLWAHDFGATNTLLLPSSRNSTSLSSNSTFSYKFEHGELMRTLGPSVKFSGFTVPFCPQEPKYPDGFMELYASSHIILPDGSHLQTGITQWCSPGPSPPRPPGPGPPPPSPPPPPGAGCTVSLTKQESKVKCIAGQSYGCAGNATSAAVWVLGGCRGQFMCNGGGASHRSLECASDAARKATCPCNKQQQQQQQQRNSLDLGDGSAPAPASARHLFVDGARAAPLPRGACYAVLAFTSKDGYNYEYVSNVSTCIENPSAEGGPNEHDCTLLPSGDVMCVMRTASGYARGMRGAPFYMTTSGDGGRSWSKPVAMVDLDGNAMGCARPHLLQLGSAILLSGGRLMMGRDYNDGFSVWLSEDAAKTWTRADVSYHHNSKANVSKVPLVPPAVNTTKGSTTKGWFGTSGYAGLVRVGEMSAAILYDWDFYTSSDSASDVYGRHPPYESLAFSMRIDLVSAKQDTPFTPPEI